MPPSNDQLKKRDRIVARRVMDGGLIERKGQGHQPRARPIVLGLTRLWPRGRQLRGHPPPVAAVVTPGSSAHAVVFPKPTPPHPTQSTGAKHNRHCLL